MLSPAMTHTSSSFNGNTAGSVAWSGSDIKMASNTAGRRRLNMENSEMGGRRASGRSVILTPTVDEDQWTIAPASSSYDLIGRSSPIERHHETDRPPSNVHGDSHRLDGPGDQTEHP